MIRWQRWVQLIGSPKTLSKLVTTRDFKPKLWALDMKYCNTAPTEKHRHYFPLQLKADLLCPPSCSPNNSHERPSSSLCNLAHQTSIPQTAVIIDQDTVLGTGDREYYDTIPAPKIQTAPCVWYTRQKCEEINYRRCWVQQGNHAQGREAIQTKG